MSLFNTGDILLQRFGLKGSDHYLILKFKLKIHILKDTMEHRPQVQRVSADQARLLIASCKELRDVCVANGKLMPAANCKVCRNTTHLMLVFTGARWVPFRTMVKYAPCLFPPKKQLIYEAILAEIQ